MSNTPDRRDWQMRAADADRERYAEQLRHAHSEGRLDHVELDERLTAVYSAKTIAELEPTVADLPRTLPAPAPSRSQEVAASRKKKALKSAWGVWAAAVSINVVIWLLVSISAGDIVYFWPMWVAGPWGIGLIFATLAARSDSDSHP